MVKDIKAIVEIHYSIKDVKWHVFEDLEEAKEFEKQQSCHTRLNVIHGNWLFHATTQREENNVELV